MVYVIHSDFGGEIDKHTSESCMHDRHIKQGFVKITFNDLSKNGLSGRILAKQKLNK